MDVAPGRSPIERLRFGAGRTLNVRASMPTGPEASGRVEAWLRSKQVELQGDVLIITGRGRGSLGGIPVVREATARTLARLRRAGVVAGFGEDTPGSFVVTLAPLRSLLEAPATPAPASPGAIHGVSDSTRAGLEYLATQALTALGVSSPDEATVSGEMMRQFTILVRAMPAGSDPDRWLATAIRRATRELDDA